MLDERYLIGTFLAVLARTTAVFAFFPIPGMKSPVSSARIVLCFAITIAMFPTWRHLPPIELTIGNILSTIIGEAALGIAGGLLLGMSLEAFQFAAQLLSQQAGFSYAATIDPTNNTDTGVLLVLAQLLTGLLFLSIGFDRQIILILGKSLILLPPGHYNVTPSSLEMVQRAGVSLFNTGAALAIPSIAVFLCIDILLGMLSRIEQQLQLTSILFPLKTAGSIAILTLIFAAYPNVLGQLLEAALMGLRQSLGG